MNTSQTRLGIGWRLGDEVRRCSYRPAGRWEPLCGGTLDVLREWLPVVLVDGPDGCAVLDPTEVAVALHASGARLSAKRDERPTPQRLCALIGDGLTAVSAAGVRALAPDWEQVMADGRHRQVVRSVWGTQARYSACVVLTWAVLDHLRAIAGQGTAAQPQAVLVAA